MAIWVTWGARMIVGLVAGAAGALKLVHGTGSAPALSKLLNVPAGVGRAASYGLALTEITLGVLMLSGAWLDVVLPIATLMFAAFGAYVVVQLRQGKAGQSCGCLGKRGRLSAVLAAQDFGLALLAAAAWPATANAGLFWGLVLAGAGLFLAPVSTHIYTAWRQRLTAAAPVTGFAQRKIGA